MSFSNAELAGVSPASAYAEFKLVARDWLALLKPRVMTLVVLTGIVGLVAAPAHLNPLMAVIAILCIGTGAGAAGAINMWYDRDIDAIMRRTARRPIPSGRVSASATLTFGVTLAVLSVMVMALATNLLAGGLLAAAILFYVLVYTVWLKRLTPQNIVIGGAAGAFPPVIGWAAVTGDVGTLPLILFAIIFFWTPPHFWALSLFAHEDYARANVPMLPVTHGARVTRRHAAAYMLPLVAVSMLPVALGLRGPVYAWITGSWNLAFVIAAIRMWREPQDAAGVSPDNRLARRMFRVSLYYLAAVFAAVALDVLVGAVRVGDVVPGIALP